MTKKNLQTPLNISIFSLLFACSAVSADETATTAKVTDKHDEQSMQQHSAHEHGVARLTLAVSSEGLEIALETPAANLFGFEHKPTDGGEEATIYETIELLENDSEIFKIPEEVGCKTPDFVIESALIEKDHEEHDEKHEEEGDHSEHAEKHEDHTSHDDHEEHTEKHGEHEAESAHNDVDAVWNYGCSNTDKLSRVGIKLFTVIPNGFEKINVEWITPTNASQVALEGDGAVFLK